ncbi:MAG: TolC family protein, partial [Methanococcaceae archaeon]
GAVNFEMALYQGAVYAGIRGAKIFAEISTENVVAVKAQTITDVKKAYYNILIVKEQNNLVAQSIKRGLQALKDVRLLYNQGLASDLDTLRAFVAVENIKPMLIKTENGISNSIAYLTTLLGLSSNESIELSDSLAYNKLGINIDFAAAQEEALAKRPELNLLDLQIRANNEMINYEFAAHLPSLAAFGQYKVELQSDDFKVSRYNWPASSYVGLNLSIPIFSGFRTQSRVEQAEIEKKKLITQLDNLKQYIATEVRVSYSNVDEARRRIEAQSQTVKAAERSYELTHSRWIKGVSRQNELFDAELALTQAKTNYLQSVYDFLVAGTELEKALGRAGRL